MAKNVFLPANILIPDGISNEKWAVVACDQFTSEPEYWKSVEKFVGEAPSTLKMIVPEAYLGDFDEEKGIKEIRKVMDEYLAKGIFKELKDSFVYVERKQNDGNIRYGLVGVVNLDEYDFSEKSNAAIIASEGTVLDRLPPRIRVRRQASLELPHIMALINDAGKTVIEPLAKKVSNLTKVYDFELMEEGGHLRGYHVSGSDAQEVITALDELHKKSSALLVMGDGNHSLAAAKAYWDEIKQGLSDEEKKSHIAKYALVEINNVYDPAIGFEAIHRVLFECNADDFVKAFESAMPKGTDYEISWHAGGKSGKVGIAAKTIGDMLSVMQDFLDEYAEKNDLEQDYIHGDDVLLKLVETKNTVGLMLPSMGKSDFFDTVLNSGVFPRKSFSIGHARDKRYYMECRKII